MCLPRHCHCHFRSSPDLRGTGAARIFGSIRSRRFSKFSAARVARSMPAGWVIPFHVQRNEIHQGHRIHGEIPKSRQCATGTPNLDLEPKNLETEAERKAEAHGSRDQKTANQAKLSDPFRLSPPRFSAPPRGAFSSQDPRQGYLSIRTTFKPAHIKGSPGIP